ncbi:PKD domain-containing protein [Cytobacillus gottheilii]|uniref:PKD domain-containing protein n=1 Tax=Cytobacillus gottheilii TaxID=859144 RepID=A0ABX8FIW9_9BACI|nr:PKD domain-containing protein [Cytobacillus gottheilii]QVY63943.1 PKD domain-containing protein [Cytobacillus gottheilii]
MKERRNKNVFRICMLIIIAAIVSTIPSIQGVSADTILHDHDGMNLIEDESLQEQYRPNPIFDLVVPVYRYESVWPVYIKKITDDPSYKGEYAGDMGFLRPVDPNPGDGVYPHYSLGRTFAHESTLSRWGEVFNGNPSYVQANSDPVTLERQSDKTKFSRYHSLEIGRRTGAEVLARKDASGNDYLEVKTSEFPVGSISAPTKVKAGEEFEVTINGTEYNPHSEGIKYEIYNGNTLLNSGIKFTDKFTGLKVPVKIGKEGKQVLRLKVTDMIERSSTASTVVTMGEGDPGEIPEPDPEEIPNMKPIADVFVEPEYYWVQEVPFVDNSFDPDGEILSRILTVDGQPSSNPKKFSRVTSITDHTVELTVIDDKGDSDTDSESFKILPTTPTAEFSINGTNKVNRRISLDGTLSDRVSPIHVAPIDYSLTNWKIEPITEGITAEDILIRKSNDRSKQDFLVRKPGDYKITLTVTNNYAETSEPVSKTITVEPDLAPEAKFTVDSAKAVRSNEGEKNAVITLTDSSVSPDDDIISKRVWSVEYDSDNDGYFGTNTDEPRKIISNGNETKVQFITNKVGNYRFSLEVQEDFGQETLEEFITEEQYLKDASGVVDPKGSVKVYQEPTNFNLPLYDKSVEVINVNPVIDFGVRRQNKIDVVLNFGGMDVATQYRQTGSRPGGGTGNGGGGGTYDHTYYAFDEADKNRLTSYASTMEAKLLSKGIDANVIIDNSYYHEPDTDGVGIRNIPVWGWRDYGYYSYSSYSGTTPYSGSWEVTSSRSEPIMEVVRCYFDNTHNGGQIHDHPPPCTDEANAIYGQVGTMYYADIRKYNSDNRFEVVRYENQGLNSVEKVDTTDFVESYKNQQYRSEAQKLYVRMDKATWTWTGTSAKFQDFVTKTRLDNVYFWNMGTEWNRSNFQSILAASNSFGQFQLNDLILSRNVQNVEDYVINKFFMEEDSVNTTIVLGDKLDYTTEYTDSEDDPEIKREWKFTHDHTEINGRKIDNQPAAAIPQSGLFIDSPLQLTEVGTYRVQLRAQDDPVYEGDERFYNYRKWSDEEVQRDYIINVHRRPIADFTFKIDPANMDLMLDPSVSYDPDHQFNRDDKGIVEHEWVSYSVDGETFDGPPPSRLEVKKIYDVTLQVKDIDGAYGVVTKRISTLDYNQKPIALFDAPELVVDTMPLNILDRSYDPDGDDLTDYKIEIKKQGEQQSLMTLDAFPENFKSISLGEGTYTVTLTVADIPKNPPSLRSDPYQRVIKVIKNNPPVSDFQLSPEPLLLNEKNKYEDFSMDIDGHALKNYSWTIEKLGDNDQVIETWNTGVPPEDWSEFGGVGRYRVTQTVFDDPPYPLTSLSSWITRTYTVVQGPQEPYAIIDYTPKPVMEGDRITLDPDRSFDPDGEVKRWLWVIDPPTDEKPTLSNLRYQTINNAKAGTYKVTLTVWDNDGLQSKPVVEEIVVSPKPPNKPPVAAFQWDPFRPIIGDQIQLNPDSSYDPDGEIVSYRWDVDIEAGRIISNSREKYLKQIAYEDYYDVTLTVTDNDGATDSHTERIHVNIASLVPFVTHTDNWKDYWVSKGFDEDVNTFMAGEQFVIRLKTSPANRVEGKIHFGSPVGEITIPSSDFKLVSRGRYEDIWETTLWREDFEKIAQGEYAFEFKGYHPANAPYIESSGVYLIQIVGNIYNAHNYHRNY